MKTFFIKPALTALLLLLTLSGCQSAEVKQKRQAVQEQRKVQAQNAQAMFKERCQKSGFFIHKTVKDVDGIFLMKIRPKGVNFADQFKLDDPYGGDTGGDGYIKNFLRGRDEGGSLNTKKPVTKGYHYVEAIDPADGKRYRYTGRIEEPWQTDKNYLKGYTRFVLDKIPAPGERPRYGVTYDDISTKAERSVWIAGSSLKVIDLKTNTVIAERIGYMMDYGQGSRAGHRSPWLMAERNACPAFSATSANRPVQIHQTRKFVEKVLHIKQEKN